MQTKSGYTNLVKISDAGKVQTSKGSSFGGLCGLHQLHVDSEDDTITTIRLTRIHCFAEVNAMFLETTELADKLHQGIRP